jgi:hypothetical protein
MSGTDSPDEGSGADTALSFDDGVAAIEGFLSRVPDALEEDDQDSATNAESQTTDEGQDSDVETPEETAGDDTDEDLDLDLDASDDGKPAPDEPSFKAGQFASRDAKVKLDDGTTISVADLIAGNMFQSTFTKKTTELAGERKALETERSEFAETKQRIERERQVILTLASELLPKPPEPVDPDTDPHGYLTYLKQREEYQDKVSKLDALWQSAQGEHAKALEKHQREQEEAEKKDAEEFGKWVKDERSKFIDAIPKLKDQKNLDAWTSETVKIGMGHYKLTPEELKNLFDHRYLLILNDAVAYRKALAKREAGAKPAPVQQQQPRLQPKQRMAPNAVQNRDFAAASDRLRKTGSLFDAAKALEKFV